VAFARVLRENIASLMFLPLSQSAQPSGEPSEIDIDRKILLTTSSWSADGRQIIYSAGWNRNRASLWRVAVAGDTAAERLAFVGEGAVEPDVSRDGRQLVFSRYFSEESIWSLELDEAGRAKGQAVRAFDSTRREQCPAFSPDGTRVVLESDRSGTDEIWICQTTGQGCRQLTKFGGPHVGSPSWSPNGEWIAFDGSGETGSVIYKIRSDGGEPLRVANGWIPRWSRDGRWIYYANTTPAQVSQLYRISPEGGQPVVLGGTEDGSVAEESPDRSWVYYSLQGAFFPTKLRRTRPAGGDVTDVIAESIAGRNFVVVPGGIWYMTPSSRTERGLLRFYDVASKLTRTVYQTELQVGAGLTLAPDGRRILFTQEDRRGSDLMLVENFR
jgi:dipeptidyl aminopeptidase/acylaminoacyl peptidase